MSALHLTYQIRWSRLRQPVGVLIRLHGRGADAEQELAELPAWLHLLHSHGPAPLPLLLQADADELTLALARELPPRTAALAWPSSLAAQPMHQHSLLRARQRGLTLVWLGEPGQTPKPAQLALFARTLSCPSPQQALHALHLARRQARRQDAAAQCAWLPPGQWVQGVASRHLAHYCLDVLQAESLLGWPADDVLLGQRRGPLQPSRHVVSQLLQLLGGDPTLERLEHLLTQDPLLVLRLLRYVNSAAVGLNRPVDAVRPALMVLGMARLRSWLAELLPHAHTDANLRPVWQALALRAQIVRALLDAGAADELGRDLLLCGLLSGVDALLGEPLPQALHGLPLPERVRQALLQRQGAYAPYLEAAWALEDGNPLARDGSPFDAAATTRALLAGLAALPATDDTAALRAA